MKAEKQHCFVCHNAFRKVAHRSSAQGSALQVGISSKIEASGMFSADGEFVEFTHPVLLEGPVEVGVAVSLRVSTGGPYSITVVLKRLEVEPYQKAFSTFPLRISKKQQAQSRL